MVRGGDGSGQRSRQHKAYPTSTLDDFKKSAELYDFTLSQGRSDTVGATMDHGTRSHMSQAYEYYKGDLSAKERIEWRKYFEFDNNTGEAVPSSASKSTSAAMSTSIPTSASTPTFAPAIGIRVRDVDTHPPVDSK